MVSPSVARPDVAAARRVVVKLGTRVLTHDDGRLALGRFFNIVEIVGNGLAAGKEVLIVSSGAVGLGREALDLGSVPVDLVKRQVCAAIGQSRLMGLFSMGFSRLGRTVAQVLLSQQDFDIRARYLNLRATLLELISLEVVPIINENDAVSVDELVLIESGESSQMVFGDNDRLSALVATELDADLLVLLTDVPGLFERDPRTDPTARLISQVDPGQLLDEIDASGSGSAAGRGGMRSKLDAALIAARGGCHTIIASGRSPDTLQQILDGHAVGTWFPAVEGLSLQRRWIAWAAASRGILQLHPEVVTRLGQQGGDLPLSGVRALEGDFRAGDVVELHDLAGQVIGRGLVYKDASWLHQQLITEQPARISGDPLVVMAQQLVMTGPGQR